MKKHKLIVWCMACLLATACDKSLDNDASLHVSVATGEHVSYDGQIITVKKGTPVEFLFSGNPDFLTFFSGEIGKKYQYRQRETIDPSQIQSSTLDFNLWFLYGLPSLVEKHIYISDEFPGLAKNDFEADSLLVERFYNEQKWREVVPQEKYPTQAASSATAYTPTPLSVDMAQYLGKPIVIAIYYKGIGNTAIQSGLNFGQMRVTNTLTNGQTIEYGAGAFGFTPLNMKHKSNFADQTTMTKDREYGTVTDNKAAGVWNLGSISQGNFNFNNSAKDAPYKYSWLVSDLITVNSCTPDQGTQIKNTTQRLEAYKYTYNRIGIYNVTFLANNINMDYASTATVNMVVNVVE